MLGAKTTSYLALSWVLEAVVCTSYRILVRVGEEIVFRFAESQSRKVYVYTFGYSAALWAAVFIASRERLGGTDHAI